MTNHGRSNDDRADWANIVVTLLAFVALAVAMCMADSTVDNGPHATTTVVGSAN